jgi:hypothetical protein
MSDIATSADTTITESDQPMDWRAVSAKRATP